MQSGISQVRKIYKGTKQNMAMKPLLVLTAFAMILAQFALVTAEDTSNASSDAVVMGDNEPSINPDSFFWGFKDTLDKFSLVLTFDSESKAKKGITIAEERLREFQKMAEEGKLEAAKKAKESHDEFIEKAKSAAKSISDSNKTEEIKKQIEIEKEAELLENKTEALSERLKIKIKATGNLTAEQRALIDSLIASMQNQSGSLKIEIEKNKEKIKIEIKRLTNKTAEEIEDDIEELETRHNLIGTRQAKAIEQIKDAADEIAKLEAEISAGNTTDNAVLVLLNNSKANLAEAQDAYSLSKYGEAYGLANAAEHLADNAREKIEKLAERDDEDEREDNETRGNKTEERNNEGKGRVCTQVITPAKNETTGECKEFPTPCDVPDGWEKVRSCSATTSSISAVVNTSAYASDDFHVEYSFGVGEKNMLDVSDGTYIKDMVCNTSIKYSLNLSKSDKAEIYDAILENGLLNLNGNFTENCDSSGICTDVTPLSTSTLKIVRNGTTAVIKWSAAYNGGDKAGLEKFQNVETVIRGIIDDKEKEMSIPRPTCGYI